MNTLLKLEFFKSLSFPSKESGMEFIKKHKKLEKQIKEKVDEMEESKYQVIEDIKEVFSQFESQKELYLVQIKSKLNEKKEHKKELKKMELKEELRSELLNELKHEEINAKKDKIKKKYSKAYLDIDDIDFTINDISQLFIDKLMKIESGNKDIDLATIEKMKVQAEKAFEILRKINTTMQKI